jgi:hypothetical protein
MKGVIARDASDAGNEKREPMDQSCFGTSVHCLTYVSIN